MLIVIAIAIMLLVHTIECLYLRVEVRVVQYNRVSSLQVDAEAARTGGQKETKELRSWGKNCSQDVLDVLCIQWLTNGVTNCELQSRRCT